ncbi:MAG: stealth family protein [Flavobacteriaceae bacterium]
MDTNLGQKLPIDAVILWVNGNDKKHQDKILKFVKDKNLVKTKAFRTRYDQVNEIKYTIDSLLKFAPFIRKIHLITDNQIPNFLTEKINNNSYNKVFIVDHKKVFDGYHKYLPTFNCRSIETCIYRIPNLSEHFIYLNDDFFLINHTKAEDFFRNGLPVLRGKWLKFDRDIIYKKFVKQRTGHKFAQQKAASIVGFKKYYNFKHTPHPLRKSTFETFFNDNRDVFINNIKHKFRSIDQFTPQGLANHIEIKNNSCVLEKDLKLIYFRSYKKPLFWYNLNLKFKTNKKLFLGLQSLDKCPSNKLKFLLNWLSKRLKI